MKNQAINPFVKHPTRKFLWVSRCGSVFNARTNEVLKPSAEYDGWGYRQVHANGENHCIHILVCETFHGEMPQPNMIGNHIDGNKANNHADNLEWATRSENSIHMYKSGLRTDNRPVHIRDVATKEETIFYSLQRAADYFKCNGEKIHRWLRGETTTPFEGRYDMRYADTNYKELTTEDMGKTPNGAPKVILLIDKDGNHSTYGSLGLAVAEVGCARETLGRQLRGTTKSSSLGDKGYIGYYLEDYTGELPDNIPHTPYIEPVKILPKRKPDPIIVKDLDTGEETRYNDCGEFAEEIGYSKSAVQKATRLKQWWVRNPKDNNRNTRPVNIRYDREEQIKQTARTKF